MSGRPRLAFGGHLLYNDNKCGIRIKVLYLVSNQEKIGQYNHSAPNLKGIYNEAQST
jgi:hypothetical protein